MARKVTFFHSFLLALRDNPKYKAKFKNQPPPEVNPSLVELRRNIKDEFERRKVNTNE